MAQDQHNPMGLSRLRGNLGNWAIPLLDPASQQGQSTSADRDVTRLLAEQGDQDGSVVNGFMTIGV